MYSLRTAVFHLTPTSTVRSPIAYCSRHQKIILGASASILSPNRAIQLLFTPSPRPFTTMASTFYDEIVAPSGVFKYYIDGQWKESSSGKAVPNTNPSTRSLAYNVQGTANIAMH